MNGVLVVDKPPGPTSHDVVARARRLLGTRRIGHTGTLDPLASGVLPLVIGQATRLSALLGGGRKEYLALVRFGRATPTYDAADRMVTDPATGLVSLREPPPAPVGLSHAIVAEAAAGFVRTIEQTPPRFSAKKLDGVAAYKRARRDQEVSPRPAVVTAYTIDVESYRDGVAHVRLVTSPGFYVRTFAHELGERVGCGAHLEGLRRLRSGEFTLTDAVTLGDLERSGGAGDRVIPLGRLLPHLPAVVLTREGARRAGHGVLLAPRDAADGRLPADAGRARLLDESGALVGIAEPAPGGLLHPVIVLI